VPAKALQHVSLPPPGSTGLGCSPKPGVHKACQHVSPPTSPTSALQPLRAVSTRLVEVPLTPYQAYTDNCAGSHLVPSFDVEVVRKLGAICRGPRAVDRLRQRGGLIQPPVCGPFLTEGRANAAKRKRHPRGPGTPEPWWGSGE